MPINYTTYVLILGNVYAIFHDAKWSHYARDRQREANKRCATKFLRKRDNRGNMCKMVICVSLQKLNDYHMFETPHVI